MDLSGLDVAVVGGGIGGMAAAVGLAQCGARVVLHERSAELGEVGAGLQVSANGQAALRALSISRPRGAVVGAGTVIRDHARGRQVARIAPPRAGPTWYLHRADLLGLLTARAEAAGVRLALGSRVAPGGLEADLIVAADGAQSGFRAALGRRRGGALHRAGGVAGAGARGRLAPVATLTLGPGAHRCQLSRCATVRSPTSSPSRSVATGPKKAGARRGDPDEFRAQVRSLWRRGWRAGRGRERGPSVGAASAAGRAAVAGRAHRPGRRRRAPDAAVPGAGRLPGARGCRGAGPGAERGAVRLSPGSGATRRRGGPARPRVVALAGGNAWRFHLRKPFAWAAQAALAAGSGLLARRLEAVYGYDPAAVPV